MAQRLTIRNKQQAVVPVRFIRAVTGNPVKDAPDIDDRGFAMGVRPGTWGQSDAKGSMAGITVGDTVQVKVLREDIESSAQLYVTSTNTSIVQVAEPAGGGPLPASGIFKILGVKDVRNTPVAIQVRLGSATGPVLGEMEPHIFSLYSIKVSVHMVTLYGTGTTRQGASAAATEQNVKTMVDAINDIWRPCGIEFVYHASRIVSEEIRKNPADNTKSQYQARPSGNWVSLPAPLGASGNFAVAGRITTNATADAHQYDEFDTLIKINFIPNTVNIYCVHDGTGWVGLCYVGTKRGLAVSDSGSAQDAAHELGHYLNNNHSDENAAGADTNNQDIWLTRRLMYSQWPAAAPPYRNDVGYGGGQYGALISLKKLPGTYNNADGELARSRKFAANPY